MTTAASAFAWCAPSVRSCRTCSSLSSSPIEIATLDVSALACPPACLPAAAAGGGLTVLYELARRVIDGRCAALDGLAGLFAHQRHRFVVFHTGESTAR